MRYRALFAILAVADMAYGQEWQSVAIESGITHVQPMTGLVLWPDEARSRYSTYGDSHALEYSYVAPCKVVTGCDAQGVIQYDWSFLETLLNDIKGRNHQAVIRFFYEYPGERMVDNNRGTSGVPACIKALPDYHETYKKVAGDGETWYADWSNAELKRFTKQFYTDFNSRYGNDPRIAFLEVGFGHWSEYHIYDDNGVDLQFDRNFPSKAYQKEFFMHLKDVLTLPWAVSIDAADKMYTPFVGDAELMSLQFGLFDDSFMHKDHEIGSNDGYNERNWIAMGKNRWHTGVCGGEVSYYRDSDQKNFTNPEGMYNHTWEEQSAKYHITFMIANDNPSGRNSWNNAMRFRQCSMATGYQFEVTECQTDGEQTKLTVVNTGVAPIYRDAYFSIGSVRSGETLRGLLPGHEQIVTIASPITIDAQGRAVQQPTIVSDFILPTQTIEYKAATSSGIKDHTLNQVPETSTSYSLSGIRMSSIGNSVYIQGNRKYAGK